MSESSNQFFPNSNKVSDVNRLLDRAYPPGYANEWIELTRKKEEDVPFILKVLIFRIQQQWFGLDARGVGLVMEAKPSHRMPTPEGSPIKGVVSVRGDLKPIADLEILLHGRYRENKESGDGLMILISQDRKEWVIKVDEIFGVVSIAQKNLENVPVNIAKSHGNLIKALVEVEGKRVSILEEELLFYALSEKLSAK
ncbi:chemotaxis protein CheW [Estrella lausannensis]|uniref:Chemotaxis signaling protein n=1 Tax=Estrella lausannensis TaxID=483423 RepID=A0A0H5E568_9BACT|nr:chemotaxis protein CheW [Estrella lausannensis]CRX38385.1 chemotaxis signaling protein [Estrella lausannensis]